MGKVEVVEVEFDPLAVSYETLLERAIAGDCAINIFTRTAAHQTLAEQAVGERAIRNDDAIRVVEDQKYYLGRTPLKYLPMTETQATRINANVKDAERWLSPRQVRQLQDIKRNPGQRPVLIDVPLAPR